MTSSIYVPTKNTYSSTNILKQNKQLLRPLMILNVLVYSLFGDSNNMKRDNT